MGPVKFFGYLGRALVWPFSRSTLPARNGAVHIQQRQILYPEVVKPIVPTCAEVNPPGDLQTLKTFLDDVVGRNKDSENYRRLVDFYKQDASSLEQADNFKPRTIEFNSFPYKIQITLCSDPTEQSGRISIKLSAIGRGRELTEDEMNIAQGCDYAFQLIDPKRGIHESSMVGFSPFPFRYFDGKELMIAYIFPAMKIAGRYLNRMEYAQLEKEVGEVIVFSFTSPPHIVKCSDLKEDPQTLQYFLDEIFDMVAESKHHTELERFFKKRTFDKPDHQMEMLRRSKVDSFKDEIILKEGPYNVKFERVLSPTGKFFDEIVVEVWADYRSLSNREIEKIKWYDFQLKDPRRRISSPQVVKFEEINYGERMQLGFTASRQIIHGVPCLSNFDDVIALSFSSRPLVSRRIGTEGISMPAIAEADPLGFQGRAIGIANVVIYSSNIKADGDFFIKALGLKPIEDAGHALFFQAGNQILTIVQGNTRDNAVGSIALKVNNLKGVKMRLQKLSYPFCNDNEVQAPGGITVQLVE